MWNCHEQLYNIYPIQFCCQPSRCQEEEDWLVPITTQVCGQIFENLEVWQLERKVLIATSCSDKSIVIQDQNLLYQSPGASVVSPVVYSGMCATVATSILLVIA